MKCKTNLDLDCSSYYELLVHAGNLQALAFRLELQTLFVRFWNCHYGK